MCLIWKRVLNEQSLQRHLNRSWLVDDPYRFLWILINSDYRFMIEMSSPNLLVSLKRPIKILGGRKNDDERAMSNLKITNNLSGVHFNISRNNLFGLELFVILRFDMARSSSFFLSPKILIGRFKETRRFDDEWCFELWIPNGVLWSNDHLWKTLIWVSSSFIRSFLACSCWSFSLSCSTQSCSWVEICSYV